MTDKELLEQAQMLRNEASDLLNKEGLMTLLTSFGTTRVIGSYTLETMTWRDIDISMVLPDEQDVGLFFEIGAKLSVSY